MPEAATTPAAGTPAATTQATPAAPTPTTPTTPPAPNPQPPSGDDELTKAKRRVTELEDEKRTRTEADAESKGQWKELVASKDERIAKLTGESGDKDKKIAELSSQLAERDILDGIAGKLGGDRKMLTAAYRELVRAKGLEVVPKDLEAAVKERAELLEKEFPALKGQAPQNTGGGSPPPRSGADPKQKGFRLL